MVTKVTRGKQIVFEVKTPSTAKVDGLQGDQLPGEQRPILAVSWEDDTGKVTTRNYSLEEELGRGSFGVVYKAYPLSADGKKSNPPVAVKFRLPKSEVHLLKGCDSYKRLDRDFSIEELESGVIGFIQSSEGKVVGIAFNSKIGKVPLSFDLTEAQGELAEQLLQEEKEKDMERLLKGRKEADQVVLRGLRSIADSLFLEDLEGNTVKSQAEVNEALSAKDVQIRNAGFMVLDGNKKAISVSLVLEGKEIRFTCSFSESEQEGKVEELLGTRREAIEKVEKLLAPLFCRADIGAEEGQIASAVYGAGFDAVRSATPLVQRNVVITDGLTFGQVVEAAEQVSVMPFIQDEISRAGYSWEDLLISLSLAERLQLIVEITLAVQGMYASGVAHRDLKPGNIIVRGVRRHGVVKFDVSIVDFGCATSKKTSSDLEGSPVFAAPEVLRARHPIGSQTDVYALVPIVAEILGISNPCESKEKCFRRNDCPSGLNTPYDLDFEQLFSFDGAKLLSEDVRSWVKQFLERMSHQQFERRPQIPEVVRFFTTLNNYALACKERPSDSRAKTIYEAKLTLMANGLWVMPEGTVGTEKVPETRFEFFDFDSHLTHAYAIVHLGKQEEGLTAASLLQLMVPSYDLFGNLLPEEQTELHLELQKDQLAEELARSKAEAKAEEKKDEPTAAEKLPTFEVELKDKSKHKAWFKPAAEQEIQSQDFEVLLKPVCEYERQVRKDISSNGIRRFGLLGPTNQTLVDASKFLSEAVRGGREQFKGGRLLDYKNKYRKVLRSGGLKKIAKTFVRLMDHWRKDIDREKKLEVRAQRAKEKEQRRQQQKPALLKRRQSVAEVVAGAGPGRGP